MPKLNLEMIDSIFINVHFSIMKQLFTACLLNVIIFKTNHRVFWYLDLGKLLFQNFQRQPALVVEISSKQLMKFHLNRRVDWDIKDIHEKLRTSIQAQSKKSKQILSFY